MTHRLTYLFHFCHINHSKQYHFKGRKRHCCQLSKWRHFAQLKTKIPSRFVQNIKHKTQDLQTRHHFTAIEWSILKIKTPAILSFPSLGENSSNHVLVDSFANDKPSNKAKTLLCFLEHRVVA